MKKILLLSIVKFFMLSGFGQTQIMYLNHITPEDGLSAPWARCMLQDQKGFIWIGSYGLDKYDGYKFTHYMPDENSPNSLCGHWVGAIMEDKSGLIWIVTTDGLSVLDPETDQFLIFSDKKPRSWELHKILISH